MVVAECWLIGYYDRGVGRSMSSIQYDTCMHQQAEYVYIIYYISEK